MFLFIKLGWRNLYRNKRRTFLSSLAIGIGLAALIFSDALMMGLEHRMIKSATSTFLGEGQIHEEKFRKTNEVSKTIQNRKEVVASLKKESYIKNVAERVMAFGMMTSPANVNAVIVIGINPDDEERFSKIDEAIVKGNFLKNSEISKILIGKKLANTLEVDIGDKVVLTVAEAESGELSQEMFRLGGIFHFGVQQMDNNMVFIHLKKSQSILAINDRIHQIAFSFTDVKMAEDLSIPVWQKYSSNGNEALSWIKLIPQLYSMLEMSQFALFLMAIILYGIVGIVIVNTLFMSLYERMFEFGVQRAIGTKPFSMAFMIVSEAASLAIISIIVGIIIGLFSTWLFSVYGIDYSGTEFMNVAINELVYPVFNIKQYITYPISLFIFTSIVGIYPAIYAAMLTPSKAMRKAL